MAEHEHDYYVEWGADLPLPTRPIPSIDPETGQIRYNDANGQAVQTTNVYVS